MEEIATFVSEASSSSSPPSDPRDVSPSSPRDMAAIYRGLAATFERVAKDIESRGEEGDVKVLRDWCAEGQKKVTR